MTFCISLPGDILWTSSCLLEVAEWVTQESPSNNKLVDNTPAALTLNGTILKYAPYFRGPLESGGLLTNTHLIDFPPCYLPFSTSPQVNIAQPNLCLGDSPSWELWI